MGEAAVDKERKEDQRKATQKYFTQADFEAGLCDRSGKAIPGGPKNPPKKGIPDSQPTKAQKALDPENPSAADLLKDKQEPAKDE
jgi:hypothetical protein